MGGQEDVVESPKRMIRGERLLLKDIERSASNRVPLQRVHEGVGIDDGTAAHVDENGIITHTGEGAGIEAMEGHIGEGCGNYYVIRTRELLGERVVTSSHRVEIRILRAGPPGNAGHGHTCSASQSGDGGTHRAGAIDQQTTAGDRPTLLIVPAMGALVRDVVEKPLGEDQHAAEHMLGNVGIEHASRVG